MCLHCVHKTPQQGFIDHSKSTMKSQERNRACPKTCVVCGDAATGYHYQTAACNRCKAFFRRAVTGMKVFSPCHINGACLRKENNIIVKQCQACRFARCVEGGMNPLCIDSAVRPEENPVIQEVLKLRPELRNFSEPSTSGCESSPVMKLEIAPRTPEVRISQLIDELSFLEIAHEKIRCSGYSPMPEDWIPLVELIRGRSKFAHEYGDLSPVSCIQLASTTTASKHGPEADALWSCMDSDASCAPVRKWSCLQQFSKAWPHADLVYAIEYLKTFEVFHQLNEDEKLLLTRWVVAICAHLTASYFSYKSRSRVTYHPDGSTVRAACVTTAPHKREYHFESIDRIRELELDEKEYVMLKAIIVCDPTIEGLSNHGRMILDEQRSRYAKSLILYMNAKQGPHKAPARFLEMLKLMDWFRSVNKRRKENHLLKSVAGVRSCCCGKKKLLLEDEIFQ